MSVKPILFNTDMVRAILDGRKTVTRRCVKYKYSNTEMKMHTDKYGTRLIEIQKDIEGETHGKNPDGSTWQKLLGYVEPKPPYQPGDILYVRETFDYLEGWKIGDPGIDGKYYYRADGCLYAKLFSYDCQAYEEEGHIHTEGGDLCAPAPQMVEYH